MFFMLLVVAGNETTRNAASGGMLAFFRGDKVVLFYSSPNRDETVFDAPFTFGRSRAGASPSRLASCRGPG